MKGASSSSGRFKAKDISKFLGVNKNKLHYWILNGLIKPEIENPVGTGTRRIFSLKNLLELALIQWLSINRHSLSYIKKMKAALDEFNPKNITGYNIFMDVFKNHCSKETVIQFYKIKENYVLFLEVQNEAGTDFEYLPSNPRDIEEFNNKYSSKLDIGKMAVNLKERIEER